MIKRIAAIGLALGMMGSASQDASARTYTFVDLGVGSTYSSEPAYSFATSINSRGDVAGYINYRYLMGSRYGAAVWSNGSTTELSNTFSVGQRYNSFANGINDSGTVVGFTSDNFGANAVKWSGGQLSVLDGLSGSGTPFVATGINNFDQIVGYSSIPRAMLWSGSSVIDLGQGYATDINNYGLVVASGTDEYGGPRGIVWKAGEAFALANISGGIFSGVNAINDYGQVVGSIRDANNSGLGVLWESDWTSSTIISMNTLDINNRGQIVGSLFGSGDNRAAIWENGTITNLNSLLEQSVIDAGWKLVDARGINDNGWIVGNAYNSAVGFHAFLLKPSDVPTPATLALLGLGLVGVARYRRSTRKGATR